MHLSIDAIKQSAATMPHWVPQHMFQRGRSVVMDDVKHPPPAARTRQRDLPMPVVLPLVERINCERDMVPNEHCDTGMAVVLTSYLGTLTEAKSIANIVLGRVFCGLFRRHDAPEGRCAVSI